MHSAELSIEVSASEPQKARMGRLRQLFHLLKDNPAGEHEALLRSMDATAQERSAVDAMLRTGDRQSSVLQTPVLDWIREFEDCSFPEEQIYGREVGKFKLEEVIGRGGSAVVFRASETGGKHRMAAVKLIHRGLYSPNSQRRFEREAQILAQLKHPSVAALLDFGFTTWGMPYLALEHVEGTDVVAYANLHALTQRERIAILVQVCNGLNVAHTQRIVHRDIKPGNILVTVAGEVKVVDFGIGRLLDDENGKTTVEVALTPSYAAPERYEGGVTRPSTDVYSLGVLASELLLGVRLGPDSAWPKEAIGDVAKERWRRMPYALKQILSMALHSAPENRYRSAGELACALQTFLANRRRPFFQTSLNAIAELAHRVRLQQSAIFVSAAMFFSGVFLSMLWTSQPGAHRSMPAHYNYQRHAREIWRSEGTHNVAGDFRALRSSDGRTADTSIENSTVLCTGEFLTPHQDIDASAADLPIPLHGFVARDALKSPAGCTAHATTPIGSAQLNSQTARANARS